MTKTTYDERTQCAFLQKQGSWPFHSYSQMYRFSVELSSLFWNKSSSCTLQQSFFPLQSKLHRNRRRRPIKAYVLLSYCTFVWFLQLIQSCKLASKQRLVQRDPLCVSQKVLVINTWGASLHSILECTQWSILTQWIFAMIYVSHRNNKRSFNES